MAQDYYTLVTGGSCGIGKAFALECARRGHNLLLAALPGQDLDETVEFLRSYFPIKADALGIDLTEKDSPAALFNWCRDNRYTVNILINNAGAAGAAVFEESSLEYSDLRIQLNIRALVLLTRLFIPEMKKLEKAYILNIGSMSAFHSIPYKSVYAATKAFVLHFTRGLHGELAGTSIKVCVLCPQGVRTNKSAGARIDAHGFLGRLTENDPEKLARLGLDKLFKGKVVIIPGFINKLLLFIGYISPSKIEQWILKKEFRKEIGK